MRQRRDWYSQFSPFLFYLKDGDYISKLNVHSPIVQERLLQIKNDPVLWARAFLITYNPITKKDEPWTARWYQAEMLRDTSQNKVYLNGRRTGKTEVMCVESLYRSANSRNLVCLFATPYESQIRLIFDRLNELILNSPLIKTEMISSTKNPFRIVFKNGSRILGFTTGAKTSSNASSLRGQRADIVLLDEMDIV